MNEYREKVTMLPLHMQESVLAYIETGRPVGHFLTALLSNDLKETFARADDENSAAIRAYVQFLYGYAPSGCWGSPAKVKEWLSQGGLAGASA